MRKGRYRFGGQWKETNSSGSLVASPKPQRSETEFHISVARLLGGILMPPVVWTTIGHGGGGVIRGGKLKRMGMKPGWPDIIISSPVELEGGPLPLMVGLELKTDTGRLSLSQAAVHAELKRTGWKVFVCRELHDVVSALVEAGVPHRRINGLYRYGGLILQEPIYVP